MKTIDKIKILAGLVFDKSEPKVFSFHDCLPDVFSRYIELLMFKRFRILGAAELMERFQMPRPGGKEAVLSFDDGRRNCWTVIFPLLKKYRIRAIFSVIPGRIHQTEESFPSLEDYWAGRVSWENLYQSHRRAPYLTWKELEVIRASGLVDIFAHGMYHDVVPVSPGVVDFQHPGVYEIPVYFDEWFQAGCPAPDGVWGAPIHERAWAPLAHNVYQPPAEAGIFMNNFVKANGGFLFFKKKNWRRKLFEVLSGHRRDFPMGTFALGDRREEGVASLTQSKHVIEERLKCPCEGFSLPLYQSDAAVCRSLDAAGYRVVFTGPVRGALSPRKARLVRRFPSFWIQFLSYL